MDNTLEKIISFFNLDITAVSSTMYRGCCPIHDGDNFSSFSIIKYKNTYKWKCFSHQCHEEYGDDLVGLNRGIKKCSFVAAKKILFTICGIKPTRLTPVNEKYAIKDMLVPVRQSFNRQNYVHVMKNHVQATNYFNVQNIPDNIIKKFELGYDKNIKRIIIPIYDHNNFMVGYDSRIDDDKLIDTIDIDGDIITKFKISYGLQKRHVLYNMNNIIKSKKDYVVLVEGYKDVWVLDSLGINAVSIFGVTISPEQVYLLNRFIKKIYICLDNDDKGDDMNPGVEGASIIFNKLNKLNFDVNLIIPPIGLDVGDFFMKKDKSQWILKELGHLVNK
jgi:DNA primase